ncbi:MAG: hypothetical protein EOO07_04330, partial [Chitinophagaceae bacterium]
MFLTLTLVLCVVFFYVRIAKATVLANDSSKLLQLQEDYSQIDSCLVLLYQADHNSRLFAATGQKSYIQMFVDYINLVSVKINHIRQHAEKTAIQTPSTLNNLIAQEKIRTQLYLKLKRLTDSLINVSSGIGIGGDRRTDITIGTPK